MNSMLEKSNGVILLLTILKNVPFEMKFPTFFSINSFYYIRNKKIKQELNTLKFIYMSVDKLFTFKISHRRHSVILELKLEMFC